MMNVQPSLPELVQHIDAIVAEKANVIPLVFELNTTKVYDEVDPILAFKRVRRENVPSFLLESAEVVEGVHAKGKADLIYSIIGTEPFASFATTSDVVDDTQLTNHKEHTVISGDPLPHLEKELSNYKTFSRYHLKPDLLNGGALGYIGYDCIRYFEPRVSQFYPLKDVVQVPESIFLMVNSLIYYNHTTKTIQIVALCHFDQSSANIQESLTASYQLAHDRIQELYNRLTTGPTSEFSDYATFSSASQGVSNVGQSGYEGMVQKLKDHIIDGDIIQAVPSQRVARPTGVHSFHIYQQLRSLNPSRYMFYIDFTSVLPKSDNNNNSNSGILGFELVGASPELLVQVQEGKVITHPIAGTRPRSDLPEEDVRLAEELLSDEKERAEHIMLVDLGRNDVNRVADPSTTQVNNLMHIERYSHVMHIVSEVTGQLRSDCNRFDAFRSIFPAGTVSGAPKIKAMELIAGLEKEKRGAYAGAVGVFSFNGNIDTCIALRTMVITHQKSKDNNSNDQNIQHIAYLQAGAGIVYDSQPTSEYYETVNKMAALARAIDRAEENAVVRVAQLAPAGPSSSTSVFNQHWRESINAHRISSPTIAHTNNTQIVGVSSKTGADSKKNRLLLIDNYDSFTWNLYQYLCQLGQDVTVFRNDAITVDECLQFNPDRVVISPGPSWPKDAGISSAVLKAFSGKVPVLGVCLGHECMVEVFGGIIEHCGEIVHGKTSPIQHDGKGCYKGIPNNIEVIRYHSLAAAKPQLPSCLEVTSTTANGIIQGLRHKEFVVEGLQFHPESIKTEYGMQMLQNFLDMQGGTWATQN